MRLHTDKQTERNDLHCRHVPFGAARFSAPRGFGGRIHEDVRAEDARLVRSALNDGVGYHARKGDERMETTMENCPHQRYEPRVDRFVSNAPIANLGPGLRRGDEAL